MLELFLFYSFLLVVLMGICVIGGLIYGYRNKQQGIYRLIRFCLVSIGVMLVLVSFSLYINSRFGLTGRDITVEIFSMVIAYFLAIFVALYLGAGMKYIINIRKKK